MNATWDLPFSPHEYDESNLSHRRALDAAYGLRPACGPQVGTHSSVVAISALGLGAVPGEFFEEVLAGAEPDRVVFLGDPSPERVAAAKARLEPLLARLYGEDAEVIRLFDLEQHSQREIGAMLGVSQPSICHRLRQARERMVLADGLPDYDPGQLYLEILSHLPADRTERAMAATVYYWVPSQSRTGTVLGWSQGKVRPHLAAVSEALPDDHPWQVVYREWGWRSGITRKGLVWDVRGGERGVSMARTAVLAAGVDMPIEDVPDHLWNRDYVRYAVLARAGSMADAARAMGVAHSVMSARRADRLPGRANLLARLPDVPYEDLVRDILSRLAGAKLRDPENTARLLASYYWVPAPGAVTRAHGVSRRSIDHYATRVPTWLGEHHPVSAIMREWVVPRRLSQGSTAYRGPEGGEGWRVAERLGML